MTHSAPAPFGTVLKGFRTRRQLTQQQLAEKLGVRRNTIGSWERGDFLPRSKGVVLEMTRHLYLDDEEIRQLLEASLTALSPYWLVPLRRNPYFTGREEILEAMHTHLGIDQTVALTQSSALHGLGGVGKTQIALEYAYRHALEYSAVFWIGAETEESIVASLLRIAEMLQLPEREDKDQQRVVVAVHRWLSAHGQWLLIWDNVEDLALLDRFLPTTRSGAILLTTRRQALGTLARGLDLLPMEQEEGILLLLRRAKVLEPEATGKQVDQFAEHMPAPSAAASELVTVLGGLPLALDQVGAYLEETQCGLPAYLNLFRNQRATLLQQRGEGTREHPASVATTFTLAIATTAQRHPAIWDLLRVCALLQPDAIPEELFRQGAEHLGTALEAACRDELEWNRVVAMACAYSLLSRQPEEQTLSVHRLVQAVLLDTMTEAEREQWDGRVIEALDAVFPEVLPVTGSAAWKQCERLLPHALLCLHRARTSEEFLVLASLACKTALYLYARGRYREAEPLYQRALRVRKQILGSVHPDVAQALNYLAALYYEQGKYTEAVSLFQQALHIWEQALGPDHPKVARALNNLALLYWRQGKYREAESLFQRSLHIWEQTLGPDNLHVGAALNNLADLYREQGRYTEAEPLFQRALSIWEQMADSDHPQIAQPLNNLADLYREQGRYTEAEPLFQRALHIREQTQGPSHPDVAMPLKYLADLYREQGRYTEAEPLFQRALSIWEQTLDLDHPLMAELLSSMATLYREQGKYIKAEPFYQRALSIREQQLGPHHPDTAQTLHDLAIFHQKQGNLDEALSLAERTLNIRSQSLGDAHPKTLATRTLSAQLVQEQTNVQEKTASECRPEAIPDLREHEHHEIGGSSPLHKAVTPVPPEDDPLQGFLEVYCELHPHAWCSSADLWQAYQHWGEERQERYPLLRGAFITQLKAHGCRADRTMAARIWHGIAVVKKEI
jgi:tetratricopeptide (TPR) repeat protein/DNA-binding XRE family transcriptional regulator